MTIDILKKHNILLNHNNVSYPKIKINTNSNNIRDNFNLKLNNTLEKYKNEINNLSNNRIWNFFKKLSNNFEIIYLKSKNSNYNIGIANYDPISRSYFKMWELIKDFKLIDFTQKHINILGLAEGPGGFIECIYNMRKKFSNDYNDKCICMTLVAKNNKVPGWKKSFKLFKENKNIKIFNGKDNTGNLYNLDNILSLAALYKNTKADFVTSDGGFDFSVNYNKQEEAAYRIIFCEIVAAISCLKKNGHFVVKIYDLFTNFTIKIIYFLTILFENVIITKPFTSRPANS